MAFKVLIPQDITDAGKDYLKERGYEVVVGSGFDAATIIKEGADADAFLVRTAPYTREMMENCKKLKVIGRHGVGVDNIDLGAATELGIQVTNAPTSNALSVAEHTIGFITALAFHITIMDKNAREGRWAQRNVLKCIELDGKVLGLVGLGRIGRMVAEKASKGLGMKVIGYDPFVTKENAPEGIEVVETKEEVFKNADFISLHIPATEETKQSINKDVFKLMKKSAFIINCARGEIMNEDDLYTALSENWIAGAALDVLKDEPPKADNPLLTLDNIIISPHNAALTQESMDRMGLHAAIGIDEVLTGKKISWPVNKL